MSNQSNVYGVIMAGGVGTRFWPMSSSERPKQFIDILGSGKTMLQETYHRLESLVTSDRIFVMTGKDYGPLVMEQLPALAPSNVLTEPVRRNTAPCIAYAAYKIYSRDPDAVMVVSPSDHAVRLPSAYSAVVRRAVQYSMTHDVLVTVGVTPTYPATGYGYIEMSDEAGQKGFGPIKRFKEKPTLDEARGLLETERYVWNSGMFVWRVRTIIEALETYLPEVALPFASISVFGEPNEREHVEEAFRLSPSISIDFGVMEKATNVHVITGEFGWDDVGTWSALARRREEAVRENGAEQSAASHSLTLIDSPDTFVRCEDTGKRVIISGLADYLVVDTGKVLLIAPKSDEEALNALVQRYAE